MTRNLISFGTVIAAFVALSLLAGMTDKDEPIAPSKSASTKSSPLREQGRAHPDGLPSQANEAFPLVDTSGFNQDKRPASSPKLLGNTSCTAAGCHGGIRPEHGVGGEYSMWLQNDPHAKAYSVLFNNLSRRMSAQLQADVIPKDQLPAHRMYACLRCHSPTAVSFREPTTFDGVGCEQCHGPAEQWGDRHVHPTWKSLSSVEKSVLGFRNLDDLSERARTCVECHTGVNHDLIAAGHPRLFFEMSAFHANLPAHWRRENDWSRHVPGNKSDLRPTEQLSDSDLRRGQSNFEAKLWIAGQLESLQFTVKLLGVRAGHAVEKSPHMPWPELVEWNCFACHHDLNGASWRQTRSTSTLAISKPTWNSWPIAMRDFLPSSGDEDHARLAREDIARLQGLMSRPYPTPKLVYETARSTQTELSFWINAFRNQNVRGEAITSNTINDMLRRLSGDAGERLSGDNWDSATQLFLGLSALTHAVHAADDPMVSSNEALRTKRIAILNSMNETLNFPNGFDSPRTFAAEPIERLRSDLKRFRETLEEGTR